MKKEKLTLDNIKKDFQKIANWQLDVKSEGHLVYIFTILGLVLVAGIVVHVLLGVVISLLAVYPIFLLVSEERNNKRHRRAILDLVDRGDVSVSVEKLSHIAKQTVYEPRRNGRRTRTTKEATFFYFEGGSSWRVPEVYRHYEWSMELYYSTEGLCNVSVEGNEFYYVSVQGEPDVCYIYPCKFFELDGSLGAVARTDE